MPKDEIDDPRARRERDAGDRRPAQAAPGPALRWTAAARRDGTGPRARAEGVPHGRAAVEPGREAPRAGARRPEAPAPAPGHHDHLRHARPGRGDDARRARRGAVGRRAPTARRAAGRLRPPREPLRRRLHRQPADEPAPRDRGGGGRDRGRPVAARCRASPTATSCWGCGRSTCGRRDGQPGMEFQVDVVEPLGDGVIVHGTVSGQVATSRPGTKMRSPLPGDRAEITTKFEPSLRRPRATGFAWAWAPSASTSSTAGRATRSFRRRVTAISAIT